MNILVIGAGYVGLVTSVCLSEIGHNVVCTDIKKDKIDKLNNEEIPIYEPGLEELIRKNRKKLTFSINGKENYRNIDVIIIAVETPEEEDGIVNLKYVYQVVEDIATNVEKDCIVITKSTVPIGTNCEIEKLINYKVKKNIKIEVVSNPEFLAQGTAVNDMLKPQRIVLGVGSKNAEETMKKIYEKIDAPYIITDRNSAEMIKYASNNFLALKISYINEIANLCESVQANIEDVVKGMGMDERIGNKYLNPGIGYGGSCFTKDTKALKWIGSLNNCNLRTINATIEDNKEHKISLIKKAEKYYECFNGKQIAILGVTFKPNTDDLREAPSLEYIKFFIKNSAKIKIFDPVANDKIKERYKNDVNCYDSIEETLKNADICFIFTEWQCIKEMDKRLFKELMKNPIIIDGRNCFNIKDIPNGIIYESIGRKIINNKD